MSTNIDFIIYPPFQFPSNGKGFPNCVYPSGRMRPMEFWFQFPSNGKGFPNNWKCEGSFSSQRVSIPFKRERLSELISGKFVDTLQKSFNSLQTGKAFRTHHIPPFYGWERRNRVSIPFKRERLSEPGTEVDIPPFHFAVSIPFKRERLSELEEKMKVARQALRP